MDHFDTLSEAIRIMEGRGYTVDFKLHPEAIISSDQSINLGSRDFQVDQVFRFEGMSDPDDQSALYAISATDGSCKGLLVSAYGMYTDSIATDILQKLRSPVQRNKMT